MKIKKPITINISKALLIFVIAFLTASCTSNKHQKSINELDRYLSDIFIKQINSNNIKDIKKYNSDILRSLTELDKINENLKSSTLANIFFSRKIRESEYLYTDLKIKYTEHIRQIDLLTEYLNSDIIRHYDFVNSYNNIFDNIKIEINIHTPIEKVQEFKNSTSNQKQLARRNIPKINEEINKTEFEGDYEKMRLGIYENIKNELVSSEKELQITENKFDIAIRLYRNHSENLKLMSRQILSQSQGINTIYQNISSMSRDLQSRVQPVREAIRTIEQPIIRTEPFGRDVTALSLINAVYPMTGRTITSVRDFCDVVLNITDNINKLGAAIEPLREAANNYSQNPNRQNAIALNESSIKTKNYLNDQRGLFDPISQRISSIRNQLNDFNRAVSNVRIIQARDLLYSFSGSVNTFLNYTEGPIRAWQSNIDATNAQFNSINRWEDDYISAINDLL